MNNMFYNCFLLISLNLSNFNINNTNYMILCSLLFLTSLNLSNNAINIVDMFYKCYSLNSLNLSNFNTNKVNDMICMFLNYYIILFNF